MLVVVLAAAALAVAVVLLLLAVVVLVLDCARELALRQCAILPHPPVAGRASSPQMCACLLVYLCLCLCVCVCMYVCVLAVMSCGCKMLFVLGWFGFVCVCDLFAMDHECACFV
jgi:hypothetical protein